jgi:hypothetical protein
MKNTNDLVNARILWFCQSEAEDPSTVLTIKGSVHE